MHSYTEEKLLILTKTYPLPSAQYREHTCVAAINQSGELRRLYPIPFRFLNSDQQFKKWEWITAKISRASSDRRTESYHLDTDSISKISQIDTKHGWAKRIQIITPHIVDSFSTLEARRQNFGISLGFIKPCNITLLIEQESNPNWTLEEIANLSRDGIFDTDQMKKRPQLKKLPYGFYYSYQSTSPDGSLEEYKHKITDWEVGALYWNCRTSNPENWERPFRKKLQDEFSQKDLFFLMGTIHRFPNQWLIVGLIYPPKDTARQYSLWPLNLDE